MNLHLEKIGRKVTQGSRAVRACRRLAPRWNRFSASSGATRRTKSRASGGPAQTHLGNRVFKIHTIFVDACSAAWNAFAAEPKRIAAAIATPPPQIGHRSFPNAAGMRLPS